MSSEDRIQMIAEERKSIDDFLRNNPNYLIENCKNSVGRSIFSGEGECKIVFRFTDMNQVVDMIMYGYVRPNPHPSRKYKMGIIWWSSAISADRIRLNNINDGITLMVSSKNLKDGQIGALPIEKLLKIHRHKEESKYCDILNVVLQMHKAYEELGEDKGLITESDIKEIADMYSFYEGEDIVEKIITAFKSKIQRKIREENTRGKEQSEQ